MPVLQQHTVPVTSDTLCQAQPEWQQPPGGSEEAQWQKAALQSSHESDESDWHWPQACHRDRAVSHGGPASLNHGVAVSSRRRSRTLRVRLA
jgi:hypothetical protein